MIRITLNLARQPGENLRRVRIVWGGGLALLAAVFLVLSATALVGWLGSRPIQAQTNAVRAQIAALRATAAPDPATNPATRAGLAQAAYFNQLIDRKSVSWTVLFQRLEQILPPGVELISLRPVVRDGANAIDIRCASDTLAPAIDFVQRLEASPDFTGARVEREAAAERTTAALPGAAAPPRIQLELTALYRGTP